MELELQGEKGSETIYADNMGKVINTTDHVDAQAGNDVYLTLDKDLQVAIYNILEQKIAGILAAKTRNIYNYDLLKFGLRGRILSYQLTMYILRYLTTMSSTSITLPVRMLYDTEKK